MACAQGTATAWTPRAGAKSAAVAAHEQRLGRTLLPTKHRHIQRRSLAHPGRFWRIEEARKAE
jgi:hypothetical protein